MNATTNNNGTAQVRHAQFADENINPVAYALENSWLWKHAPSRRSFSSRHNSRVNTPAPSKPASVHEEHIHHDDDANINPVAYALENSWLWKHSPSRSHSRAQSRAQTPAASKRPSMDHSHAARSASTANNASPSDADINPVAYAMQNSWLWKHSPF